MRCRCQCYKKVEDRIGRVFAAYGRFVARHPWKIIVIAIFVNGMLGIGMIRLENVIDVQRVYTPIGSQASKDSEKVRNTFPDDSETNFIGYQRPDLGRNGEVIVVPNGGNILDTNFLAQLTDLYNSLWLISAKDEHGSTVQLIDICAKTYGNCSIDGHIFVDNEFVSSVSSNSVPYPVFTHTTQGQIYYEQLVGGASVSSGTLNSARALLLRVNLRTDSEYYVNAAKNWQDSFKESLEAYTSDQFAIAFSHSDSLSEELNENVSGDITYFSVTFTMMITYACIATMTARCDCVGQRSNLGFAGVLAAGLAIVSAFGLTSACGVEFVSIVGVVPFLIIGIGVDDMFMLMSGITETNYDDDIETRIGETMRTSGISITITSLTDLLAFAAGASSVFLSVRNFCIYAGIAVVFCYINQATMFMACIAINEKRVGENRHYATCMRVDTADECRDNGKTESFICCCSGRPPRNQTESESYLDRVPRWLVPKLISPKPMKVLIIIVFMCYLAVSVWGITEMEQGLDLKDLVAESSYYYKFRNYYDTFFPQGTSVSVVFDKEMMYSDSNVQTSIGDLLAKIKDENTIKSNFEIANWLTAYQAYAGYDATTESSFVTNLQTFLSIPTNQRYENDVVIDASRNAIIASRFHLMSESIKDTQEQGSFMLRMRELVDGSSFSVFAFSPAFIFYEQYVVILSQTLQTVGIAVGMVFFVTCVFMPHPLLLIYITVTVAMITAGIFGFLPFLGLTLSSVTMIHIIMSIGFSVDFAAHICHGYMISSGETKTDRMNAGIKRSGAPIFHGAISSLLGVVMLAFADSFIFYSFFQVMSLVITFGILHALLLLPVVLSLIGPSVDESDSGNSVSPSISDSDIQKDHSDVYGNGNGVFHIEPLDKNENGGHSEKNSLALETQDKTDVLVVQKEKLPPIAAKTNMLNQKHIP